MVWIWGSGRSGSTWLLSLLAHPLLLDERDPLGVRVDPGAGPPDGRLVPLNESYFANHLAPERAIPRLDGTADAVPAAYTLPGQQDWNPGYLLRAEYREVWAPAMRRVALDRFAAQVGLIGERIALADPLVVVKEVNGSHAADQVMELFPSSRMLWLVRDGRDVVDSLAHAHQPDSWISGAEGAAFTDAAERLDFVRAESLRWARRMAAVEAAWVAHETELRLRVRYEDLLADPVGELGRIAAWTGLGRDERWAREAVAANDFEALPAERKGPRHPHRAATPGLWRENFGTEERKVAAEAMAPWLERLGYSAD